MKMWLRLTLIWLLALALPAQGLAAATMAFCPLHHAAPAALVGLAAAPEHCGDAASAQQADGHKCSACAAGCAACCSAAAMHSIALQVLEPSLAPQVFAAVLGAVKNHSPSGPERPPRARNS